MVKGSQDSSYSLPYCADGFADWKRDGLPQVSPVVGHALAHSRTRENMGHREVQMHVRGTMITKRKLDKSKYQCTLKYFIPLNSHGNTET